MHTPNQDFAQDVKEGLTAPHKYLSSKYFYDAKGDALFQQIMGLPEYYLTRAEFAILDQHKHDILQTFIARNEPFNLIEMGAGDGLKTRILLRYLYEHEVSFTYYPVDISLNVLQQLKSTLQQELPSLAVMPIQGTYDTALAEKNWEKDKLSLMLFLGSNLGNFLEGEATGLLSKLSQALRPGEKLLAGFDLKKDPEIVLNAYNDSQGVTRDFNLNLLHRINRELRGNFDVGGFKHWPVYDPMSGECKSYLISMKKQSVRIEQINLTVHFERYEPVFTEVSKKYSLAELKEYASFHGFEIQANYVDEQGYFTDSLWTRTHG
ncbi:MAG TPA: L-histidine N(alpha)-methyltransferase [Cyclobacteriaceae bacterium]|nr:L-histidine N(alpha)-methyltransferase [Cyclobacteriaceae bacterium]